MSTADLWWCGPSRGICCDLHRFVDSLKEFAEYRAAEERVTKASASIADDAISVETAQAEWQALNPPAVPEGGFAPAGQDVINQCIHGLGWRVTGKTDLEASHGTRSYLLESSDERGIKLVVTALQAAAEEAPVGHPAKKLKKDLFEHFAGDRVTKYLENQKGRQGIAVLAFGVASGTVEAIEARYRAKHPELLVREEGSAIAEYPAEGFKILDVFAYYTGEVGESEPDRGTVLRFVQRTPGVASAFLPGLEKVAATFCGTVAPAYFDHWVSNVVSRTGFLRTLNDTLDFDIKVDFNAGVVAAGEAQIESTVTGNVGEMPSTLDEGLVSQSQVFLPTNNALSPVGHVHLFLEEIGQGIQHIASRVEDLTDFIHRVNRARVVTGEGFTFLNIPPSYYGRLTVDNLAKPAVAGVGLAEPVSPELAAAVLANLERAAVVDETGIVAAGTTLEVAAKAAAAGLDGALADEFSKHRAAIAAVVVRGRYSNLYKLIGDHLPEEKYLKIVENKVLVDIQNGDILYQIFTCNVLQRVAGDESPFFEFIQRVCSQKCNPDGSAKPIKPGCGGFGIRNFLTLFLSIEVTKAMNERHTAIEEGNAAGRALAEKKVEIFTAQLNEANPILTAISDAMTAQGDAKDQMVYSKTAEEKAAAEAAYKSAESTLHEANAALLECSTRHSEWMRKVCEEA